MVEIEPVSPSQSALLDNPEHTGQLVETDLVRTTENVTLQDQLRAVEKQMKEVLEQNLELKKQMKEVMEQNMELQKQMKEIKDTPPEYKAELHNVNKTLTALVQSQDDLFNEVRELTPQVQSWIIDGLMDLHRAKYEMRSWFTFAFESSERLKELQALSDERRIRREG